MALKHLFLKDPTRGIPPVVYFHDQSPEKLAAEVSEYIVTGGWPKDHPSHRRVPRGIHEEYVGLLRELRRSLDDAGSTDLPAVWISGFYGSGKSSFAKLLGLALDGRVLPDGRPLADALIAQDGSPLAAELREAWDALRARVDPLSVVFDIGGEARADEPIHSAVLRKVQQRLGYANEPTVADHELALERDGLWDAFVAEAQEVHGRPWTETRHKALVVAAFSQVMHALQPDRYETPMAWYVAHSGSQARALSASDTTRAIGDMLDRRAPGRHLFVVVDEVSQYIHQDNQRMLALQSFVSDLGQRLRGRVWLLVTGQEKLDAAGDAVLGKMKDRFPPRFRVHLAATNIRDVVHRRLLEKTEAARPELRALYARHRDDLQLFAYGCEQLTEEEFVETYPLLPGYIELLGKITTELRRRSDRSQGDDQAIRGLLQLLGELFRAGLADRELGALVTLEDVYDVQHTALNSDAQATLARLLAHCADLDDRELATRAVRAAKAVALLEQVQEELPTTAELVARVLHDRVDRGAQVEAVHAALEHLRRANLLGYSEKLGYKIQSTAGEEWEKLRDELGVTRDEVSELVKGQLALLVGELDRPRLQQRGFPWEVVFSDDRAHDDTVLQTQRDAATVVADLRFVPPTAQDVGRWVDASGAEKLRNRLVWVVGNPASVDACARELGKSQKMVSRHGGRRDALSRDKVMLLLQEETRREELERALRKAVEQAFLDGALYFRGQQLRPRDHGTSFRDVLLAVGERHLDAIYPQYVATQLQPTELAQLLAERLNGLSPKFMEGELGLFELDAGTYVASCAGVVPTRVAEFVGQENGTSGHVLLERFASPPYGWATAVTRAALLALLRAKRVAIVPDGGQRVTAVRDPGVQDLFTKDTLLRRASVLPVHEDGLGRQARAAICRLFKERFQHDPAREDAAIANAVSDFFPRADRDLAALRARFAAMGTDTPLPPAVVALDGVLKRCIETSRYTETVVQEVSRQLVALRDGLEQLAVLSSELGQDEVQKVRAVALARRVQGQQLRAAGALDDATAAALAALDEGLAVERPWTRLTALQPAADVVRAAYVEARDAALAVQQHAAEAARARLRARTGFERLTGDERHEVLRPIHVACDDPTPDRTEPTLLDLRQRFPARLADAEEAANDLLDELLEQKDQRPVIKVDLRLNNRELASPADIDALAEELRAALRAAWADGRRLRLRVS